MGRYAQASRRGGGVTPYVAPPTPVTFLDVAGVGTAWRITFSGPVTVDPLAAPSSEFSVDGAVCNAPVLTSPTTVEITDNLGVYASGLNWVLSAQPPWLLVPAVTPDAGVTTF